MEKKISSAFTYIFKDSEWKFKSFIIYMITLLPFGLTYLMQVHLLDQIKVKSAADLGSLTSLISILILVYVVSFILNILMYGYENKSIHNIILLNKFPDNPNFMPRWEENFFDFFRVGFLYMVILFLLSLLLMAFLGSGVFLIKSNPAVSILLMIVSLILLGIYGFYLPALQALFALKYDLRSFFQLGEARKIVSSNTGNYLAILFMMFLISVVSSIVISMLKSSILLVIIAPFIATYTFFVYIYLKGIIISDVSEIAMQTEN